MMKWLIRCGLAVAPAAAAMTLSTAANAQNAFVCVILVGASATGTNSTACGTNATANGNNSTAVGFGVTANGASSTAYGSSASSAVGATAIGASSIASGTDSIAFGRAASATNTSGIAIGTSSSSSVANGIALGPSASVTASGAVAIGSGSLADTANTVSVGTVGGERKIVNVANGTLSATSKDVVNGGQLFTTNSNVTTVSNNLAAANTNFATANTRLATALGGGSTVDVNGVVTAPSYTVQGSTYNNVGGALGGLDSKVTTNTTSISNLTSQISTGAIGLVQQDVTSRNLSIGSATDGTLVDLRGTIGPRRLTGLLDGTVSAGSSDAVTGSQLNTTNGNVTANTSAITANTNAITTANTNFATANSRIASAFGGGSSVDGNGIVTAPSYTVQGTTYNNVGGALGGLDSKVTTNTTNIANLNTQIATGLVGLVQQNATTRNLSVGGAIDGTLVDVTGTAGTRKLTGLSAGTISAGSSDAITGAQLNTTNGNITTVSNGLATANTNFATANTRIATAFGGGSSVDGNGIVTAPSYTVQGATYNNVGGALGGLDSKVTTNTTSISNLTTQISTGAIGVVQQDATTRNISIGSATDGTLIDLRGTIGPRKLTGLLDGTVSAGSSDAVTGSQLNTTNSNVTANTSAIAANTGAIATANTNFATANTRIASAFGGGSTVDGNGIVTAPSYTVQGTTYNNVGGALGGLDSKVTTNTTNISNLNSQIASGLVGVVQQNTTTRNLSVGAATDGMLVDLTGTAGTRKLTGLSAGTISAGSSDAITGAQLNTTNGNVTTLSNGLATANSNFTTANTRIASAFGGGSTVDGNGIVTAPSYTVQGTTYNNVGGALGGLDSKVTSNTTSISSLNTQIASGAIGMVQQDATSRNLSFGAATDGTLVDLRGTIGPRKLTGLLDGTVSAGSSDAVTGSQLNTTNSNVTANTSAITANTSAIGTANTNFATANTRIASAFGGGSSVDGNGIVTAPSYTVQGTTYNNVGGALGELDSKVTGNTTSISNLNSQIATGAIGLAQQDATTRNISIGAATDGTLVSLRGTIGPRKLTGLLDGTVSAGSSDAVTGSQLNTTNGNITTVSNGLATASSNFATANTRIASAFGGGSIVDGSGIVTAPNYTVQGFSYNNVGGAIGAIDTKLTTNTLDISSLTTLITGGTIGLVKQDPITRNISFGAATNGSLVDFTGTAGTRKLTGLSSGTLGVASADAVTGAQLFATNSNIAANASALATANSYFLTANQRMASALGGGSIVDANGIVTTPVYTVQGSTYSNVGGALGGLDNKLTSAVNNITNLGTQITSGALGLVQQNALTRNISVAAGTDGTLVDLRGSVGARKLTGLLDGTVSSISSDAVTGAQLYAVDAQIATGTANFATANQRLAAMFGGGAGVDANGIITAPTYGVLGSNYNNVGGALTALSNRVTMNTTDISALTAGGTSGSGMLVYQDPTQRTITVGATSDGTSVNVAGVAGNRTISGVAAGTLSVTSTDVVNGAQLAATNATVATTASYASNAANGLASALGGNATVAADGTMTAPQYTIQQQSYNSVGAAFAAVDTVLSSASTTMQSSNTMLQQAEQKLRYVNATGTGASASATGAEAIAFGSNSNASGDNAIAMGMNSVASKTGAIAMGSTAQATGVNAIAIGTGAVATGSVALGATASAANGAAALGDRSVATGPNSAALGPNATATAANAVAIGSGSVATEANIVSVGAAGAERRITNVAAGVAPTDAVNVAQLSSTAAGLQGQISSLQSSVDQLGQTVKRTTGGVAMAMAMSGGGLPDNKRFGVGMNVGTYSGQYALSVSNYFRVNNSVVLSSAVAYQDGQVGARAGLMAAW